MADRNREFLKIRAGQLAEERFKQQLQVGEAAVLDRFGIPIRSGAMVVWRPPFDLIFQVLKAEALVSLDPRRPVPPGMMTLTISSGEFPLNLLANQPQMTLIHCGQVPRPSDVMGNGAEPRPEDARTASPDTDSTDEEPHDG